MKKLLVTFLASLLMLSCLACSDEKNTPNEEPERKPALSKCDTIIQDDNGVDKCFWEDGLVSFNDHSGSGRQQQKSALLDTQTEYDMWLRIRLDDLDLANYFYPVEFEYDATKIEIKANPNKENHFILKVLQSCEQEQVSIKLTSKSIRDDMLDENGEPVSVPIPQNFSITISTII